MMREDEEKGYFVCPHCGASIPADSPVCPECGSDNETGWAEDEQPADRLPPEEEQPESVQKRSREEVVKFVTMAVGALLIMTFAIIELPYGIIIVGAVVLAAVIGYIIFRKRPLSKKRREKALEKKLLMLSGRDPERVERLVMSEQNRKPGASRDELLQNVIDRLLHDRVR